MPKFLHTADIHIGASYNIIPDYLSRHGKMLKAIYKTALRKGCKFVLISGDLFQKHDKPAKTILKEQDLLLSCLLHYDQKIPTVIISGNHDQIDDDGQTMIDNLALLEAKRKLRQTYIVNNYPRRIEIDSDTQVLAFPPDTDVHKFMTDPDWYESGKYKYVISMMHEAFGGYQTDTGWTPDPKDVKKWRTYKGVTYYALGDIHMPQSIKKCNHAWYSGSPIQHNFGDGQKRGVLVVDLDVPTNPKLVRLPGIVPLMIVQAKNLERVPTDAYVRLDGSIEEIAELGELPPNVVKTKQLIDMNIEVAEIESHDDKDVVTMGLAEWLKAKGHGPKFIEYAIELVKRIFSKRQG